MRLLFHQCQNRSCLKNRSVKVEIKAPSQSMDQSFPNTVHYMLYVYSPAVFGIRIPFGFTLPKQYLQKQKLFKIKEKRKCKISNKEKKKSIINSYYRKQRQCDKKYYRPSIYHKTATTPVVFQTKWKTRKSFKKTTCSILHYINHSQNT